MGADMMAAMHRMPDQEEGETTEDAYRRLLAATSDRDKAAAVALQSPFLEWPDDIELPFDLDDACDGLNDDEVTAMANSPALMAFIEEQLDHAVTAVMERQTAVWRIFGIHVAITGGMSWGDAPTEAYTGNLMLGDLPAFEIPTDVPAT